MNPDRTSQRGSATVIVFGALLLACVITAWPTSSATREEVNVFVARPVRTFVAPNDQPLHLPTSVSIAADGRVFVADGVNDRIVVFAADARFISDIRRIGDESLSNPTSVKVDTAGRLWIADTGHARVIVWAADGSVERIIKLPRDGVKHPPDVTDVAVSADGQRAWLIDNDNHRIGLYDVATESWRRFVPARDGGDVWYFPFMAALSPQGRLYVTDVANGRVQSIVEPATLGVSIGRYGVEPGQLYRPKGVALDDDGNVWVSDSVLGVVQVFANDGRLRSVLRDTNGEVLRLNTPCGIAWHQDHLYVVEMMPGHVTQFRVGWESRPIPPAPPSAPAPRTPQPQQCTICHIEWMSPFDRGMSTELMEAPVSTREQPYVSRQEICLSCHDGSISDSRRRVWLEHGHATGTAPSPSMSIPADLPLVHGKMDCRTCHSAHTHGGAGQTMFDAVFLRVEHSPDELCIKCHADSQGTVAEGKHPSGSMLAPLPKALQDAGARIGPAPTATGCMACHTAHGGAELALLLPTDGVNQLCLTCHESLAPDRFGEQMHTFHPLTAALSESVNHPDRNTNLMDCLSCHRMHEAVPQTHLLTSSLNDGRLCLDCHQDYSGLFGTTHDLRHSAPEETNLAGLTADQGGPCSACHSVHSLARPVFPTSLDPAGNCATCHRPGECAEGVTPATVSHPLNVSALPLLEALGKSPDAAEQDAHASLTCTSCHDPHRSTTPWYLHKAPDQLCATCHTPQSELLSGGHDFHNRPDALNAKGLTVDQSGRCGFCHSVHDAPGLALWSATPETPTTADAMCTACHRPDSPLADRYVETAHHPAASLSEQMAAQLAHTLPLFDDSGHRCGDGSMSCATCHDPHGSAPTNPMLLRLHAPDNNAMLCVNCHTEEATVAHSFHAPEFLERFPQSEHACGPCHVTHGAIQVDVGRFWTGPVGPATAPLETQLCIGCHSSNAGMKDIAFQPHPQLPMPHVVLPNGNASKQPVSVTSDAGTVERIGCATCHLPHGQRVPSERIPLNLDTSPSPRVHAAKPMLRPYTTPNLCSSCHGFEGLRLFLYYHDNIERMTKKCGR